MKILVLGSGVIGVTTAYMLAARGHQVEVVERNDASAMETSFANGGQLSYSHAEPWANPSVLPKVMRWMFKKDAPLVLRPRADLDMIKWGLQFLANCTLNKAHNNCLNILRLGLYSRKKMEQLRSDTRVEFDYASDGILHVFSSESEMNAAVAQSKFQEKYGCKEDVLSRQQCLDMEPALEHAGRAIIGGIHAPLDESGDVHSFTQNLAKYCAEKLGVVFHYNTTVINLVKENGRITGVETSKGLLSADSYLISMGSYVASFLRKVGIKVPVYPMKGYSITLPANIYAPKVSITDGEMKVVYSRLGNRLRVAGTAEFAGFNTAITGYRVDSIKRGVMGLFPKAYEETNLTDWACLRPQTPDGPPIMGKTPIDNLFLNIGHGTLGWTQGAGSAAILADIIEGKEPEIKMTGLDLARYA